MTDDTDWLREACEMAGMDVFPDPKWDYEHIISTPMGDASTRNPFQVEWIESRCADLLVGKVWGAGVDAVDLFVTALGRQIGEMGMIPSEFLLSIATPAQRITAAMDVLKRGSK